MTPDSSIYSVITGMKAVVKESHDGVDSCRRVL